MLCVLSWTGCQAAHPYLRDLRPDPTDSSRVSIETAYLKAMLADLDACYGERK